jgi:hypothetical protein
LAEGRAAYSITNVVVNSNVLNQIEIDADHCESTLNH